MMLFHISIVLFHIWCIAANIVPLSDTDKQECVNGHNDWRIRAGATAMLKMKWNDTLAKLSESFAARCKFDHSSFSERSNAAGFSYVGENIYVGSAKASLKHVGDKWAEEVKDYDVQTNRCSLMCGHYTQMVWSSTSDVGCAISQCDNVLGFGRGYLIFCNYGPGGNMMGEKPYEKGPVGSKCMQKFGMQPDTTGLCGNQKPDIKPNPQITTTFVWSTPKPDPGHQTCKDTMINCPTWAKQCKQISWLASYCPKTCKAC